MRLERTKTMLLAAGLLAMGCSGDEGDGSEAVPYRDAGPPATVDETVDRLQVVESRFVDRLCACSPYREALEELFLTTVDESMCRQAFTSPDAQWSCLKDHFGSEAPDAVPGLACELRVRTEAIACLVPLQCGQQDAPDAADCVDTLDQGLDDCNLHSLDSESPPDLLECL